MTIVSLRVGKLGCGLIVAGRGLISSSLVASHKARLCERCSGWCRGRCVRVCCFAQAWCLWCSAGATARASSRSISLLVPSLKASSREIVGHRDANINVSTFIIVVCAELELDVLVDLELDVVTFVCFFTELNIAIMVTMANHISVVLVVRLIRVCIVVTEVRMLVMDWLLAHLEEVVRVELQSAHLLSVR